MIGIEIGYFIAGAVTGSAGLYFYKCDCDKKRFKKSHTKESQMHQLRDFLEGGNTINYKTAKSLFKITSLGSVVHKLRAEGVDIETITIKGQKMANYQIKK
jgi:hypothetical protein